MRQLHLLRRVRANALRLICSRLRCLAFLRHRKKALPLACGLFFISTFQTDALRPGLSSLCFILSILGGRALARMQHVLFHFYDFAPMRCSAAAKALAYRYGFTRTLCDSAEILLHFYDFARSPCGSAAAVSSSFLRLRAVALLLGCGSFFFISTTPCGRPAASSR